MTSPPGDGPDDGAFWCSHGRIAAAASASLDRTEMTPNQGAWDALEYQLFLEIEPDSSRVTGSTWIRFRSELAAPARLDSVELDLKPEMVVSRVSAYDGTPSPPLYFRQENDLLIVRLPRRLRQGEELTLSIDYQGAPSRETRDGFRFDTIGGETLAWSFGGPRGARRWWPCKDHPGDKADSVTIQVTVPDGMEVVANGTLTWRSTTGAKSTFHWKERHPIATYLVALSAYPYSVYEDHYIPDATGEAADTMPIVFYNYPSSRPSWEPVQAKLRQMLRSFAGRFGEYPFLDEKYGHAQVPFSGGMEHQTITSLGSNQELVVAHELAHQWWGDEVTCADFHDIWLNEGFATYCEALWQESSRGAGAYRERMAQARSFGSGSIYVPDTQNPDRIYDRALSYNKGAWILHMLRGQVGDALFFPILREYRARRVMLGGTARTPDLAEIATELGGSDYGPYFERWIYGEGYPIYRPDWSVEPDGPDQAVNLRVRQLQEGGVFPMQLTLAFVLDAEEEIRVSVWNGSADTTYRVLMPRAPIEVRVDPDERILRKIYEPMPAQPAFDRPFLLVNGVPWRGESGATMRAYYRDGVLTDGRDFDFWDYHPEPTDGYPDGLPAPLGHGEVPGEVLTRYRALLWVGNTFGGDATGFEESPLHAWLEAGGNLFVIAPSGRTFLPTPYRDYLGIDWVGGDSVSVVAEAMIEGLPDLIANGAQEEISFFRLSRPVPGAEILYADKGDPDRGVGVAWTVPTDGAGGTESGRHRFVYLGGRPYRWNADRLRAAVSALHDRYLAPPAAGGARLFLRAPAPNPSSEARTKIAFLLPQAGQAELALFDVQGRRIRVLRNAASPAGWNAEIWDGRDDAGESVASGVYFARLEVAGASASTRVVRLK